MYGMLSKSTLCPQQRLLMQSNAVTALLNLVYTCIRCQGSVEPSFIRSIVFGLDNWTWNLQI